MVKEGRKQGNFAEYFLSHRDSSTSTPEVLTGKWKEASVKDWRPKHPDYPWGLQGLALTGNNILFSATGVEHEQRKDFGLVKCLLTVELCLTLWPFIFLGMHAMMSVWNTEQGDCHNQLPEPWRKSSRPMCPLFGENSVPESQGVALPIIHHRQRALLLLGTRQIRTVTTAIPD